MLNKSDFEESTQQLKQRFISCGFHFDHFSISCVSGPRQSFNSQHSSQQSFHPDSFLGHHTDFDVACTLRHMVLKSCKRWRKVGRCNTLTEDARSRLAEREGTWQEVAGGLHQRTNGGRGNMRESFAASGAAGGTDYIAWEVSLKMYASHEEWSGTSLAVGLEDVFGTVQSCVVPICVVDILRNTEE